MSLIKDPCIEDPDTSWPYCRPLMCAVNYIGSASQSGVVVIDLVGGDCCDMSGAVSVCESLWPTCHEIRVSANNAERDIIYAKRDGQWIALEPTNARKTV